MLSFVVFAEDGPAQDWPLRQAMLLGADDAPVSADVRFEAGVIRASKPGTESAALSLQVAVGPGEEGGGALGVLVARTCLLPDRVEPYLLSLELARHQLMLVLNKLEQWGLFDLPSDDPIMAQLERARAAFTAALVAPRTRSNGTGAGEYTLEAERAARRSLAIGVDLGERLALLQGKRQLELRLSGEAFAQAAERSAAAVTPERPAPEGAVKSPESTGVVLQQAPMLGCRVNPEVFDERLASLAASMCDFISVPMPWVQMEPSEGKYAFARTDRWIEWAVRQARVPVVAGPVIDLSASSVPEWLYIWEHDYETLRELVYEHMKAIVTRYRRAVSRWTIASGLHVNDNLKLTVERVMDLTRVCVLAARKLHPAAKIQVEISEPWGEYFARSRRAIPPMLYAEMVAQSGLGVDAFALRVEMGRARRGAPTRDLLAFSDLLDRYATLDKPIVVTCLGAPGRPPAPDADPEHEPGHWRSPWDPGRQGEWLAQAVAIALGKTYVHSVCWQDLCDTEATGAGGLLAPAPAGWAPKPAGERFGEIHRQLAAGRRAPHASPAGARGA